MEDHFQASRRVNNKVRSIAAALGLQECLSLSGRSEGCRGETGQNKTCRQFLPGFPRNGSGLPCPSPHPPPCTKRKLDRSPWLPAGFLQEYQHLPPMASFEHRSCPVFDPLVLFDHHVFVWEDHLLVGQTRFSSPLRRSGEALSPLMRMLHWGRNSGSEHLLHLTPPMLSLSLETAVLPKLALAKESDFIPIPESFSNP